MSYKHDDIHRNGGLLFEKVPDSDAEMFIQWKGTDVCMDFACGQCGADQHIDDDFTYFIRCPQCGAVYALGTQVRAFLLADPTDKQIHRAKCEVADRD